MGNIQVRTDLALESHENYNRLSGEREQNGFPPGVIVDNSGGEQIKINRVRIINEAGERALGKPVGNYITLEIPGLKNNDKSLEEKASKVFADELAAILNLKEFSMVMIVGLGNWNVTPDSLGPKVVSTILVTRHLIEFIPEQLKKGVRPVCAVAPGVLGMTGIETGEIVKGIAERVKPDVIIAIDALASRKMERISTTIQIADTGISPGSGVGNRRMELSRATLGVPVVAVGVPTVVDAATMANDTIDLIIDGMLKQAGRASEFYKILKSINREEKLRMIGELMEPYVGNLIVTPREIDDLIERIARIISNGLNICLHQGISADDVNRYLH